jgi:outer membrane receptor protein involved in Fe transport
MAPTAYSYGGVTDTWYLPGGIGSAKAPSYYTLDMRVKYVRELPIGKAEFFLDVFNVLDKQSVTDVVKNNAGDGIHPGSNAATPSTWVQPRRAYLGVRYAF